MMHLSLQEIFDQTVQFLAKQGKWARADGVCAYRGNDGCKCAYGAWIPDAVYTRELEGCALPNVKEVSHSETRAKALFAAGGLVRDSQHHRLMRALQSAHDEPRPGEYAARDLRVNLTKVAAEFNLDGGVIGTVVKWSTAA